VSEQHPSDSRAQTARESAAAQLEVAAERFAVLLEVVRVGNGAHALLRERRRDLEAAAIAYCAAHGHPPAAGAA